MNTQHVEEKDTQFLFLILNKNDKHQKRVQTRAETRGDYSVWGKGGDSQHGLNAKLLSKLGLRN